MSYPRFASYVVDRERSYWVTTMVWESYWGPRPESGIRDLERTSDECFTLIQHDDWDLAGVQARIVALLKQELSPAEVRRQIYVSSELAKGWRVGLEEESIRSVGIPAELLVSGPTTSGFASALLERSIK